MAIATIETLNGQPVLAIDTNVAEFPCDHCINADKPTSVCNTGACTRDQRADKRNVFFIPLQEISSGTTN